MYRARNDFCNKLLLVFNFQSMLQVEGKFHLGVFFLKDSDSITWNEDDRITIQLECLGLFFLYFDSKEYRLLILIREFKIQMLG